VTHTALTATVRLALNVDGTLAKMQGSHTITCLKLEASACVFTLTGQALKSKNIEAEPIGAVIKRFGSDTVKHV